MDIYHTCLDFRGKMCIPEMGLGDITVLGCKQLAIYIASSLFAPKKRVLLSLLVLV